MNFLYNLIGKGNKQQQTKYDKVTFKISLSDHIPQFYEASSTKVNTQQQLTPDNPIYYQLFPKNQQNYVPYTVKQNDTIFGLSIKLDISEKIIRDLNDLSGNIYPGMHIKFPQGTILQLLEDQQPVQQNTKLRISQLLSSEKISTINHKYIVYYYVGLSGHIKGTLSINQNYVIFNPLLEDEENLKKFTIEKLLKFNALVETVDIAKVETMKIPMIDEMSNLDVPKYNNVVLFNLYKVGNTKIQKKYKERLKQLKIDHKAIASVSFSFSENEEDNEKMCQQVSQIMNSIVQKNQKSQDDYEQKKRLTNIPFFDIIHENIHPKQEKPKNQSNHIIRQSAILGILNSESDIITNEHFQNLVKGFPILYKLYNWNKIYSTRKDGSSFNTLLNKAKYIQPIILLIKQYKGNILGAFIVENLQTGKTGRGQMFIFTYRQDSKKPEVFEWTTKNQFFVYIEKDQGIGIGMGLKYGIFLRNTLDKGSSARTQTFGNPDMLSKKQDFLVDDVQIWGVDSSF